MPHLVPDVARHKDGHGKGDAEDDVLGGVVGFFLQEEDAQVDEEDLFGEGQEGGEGEGPEVDVASGEDGGREVGGDCGKADEEDDLRLGG
jgi:hypothetical protein